jgi:hypothetical protein
MNDFEWVLEILPCVHVGLRFTIPTNESVRGYVVEVIYVGTTFCTVTWRDKRNQQHRIDVSVVNANEFIKNGMWEFCN